VKCALKIVEIVSRLDTDEKLNIHCKFEWNCWNFKAADLNRYSHDAIKYLQRIANIAHTCYCCIFEDQLLPDA
jgi:hypothetical protein